MATGNLNSLLTVFSNEDVHVISRPVIFISRCIMLAARSAYRKRSRLIVMVNGNFKRRMLSASNLVKLGHHRLNSDKLLEWR